MMRLGKFCRQGVILFTKPCYFNNNPGAQTSWNRNFVSSPFLRISCFGDYTQTKHISDHLALPKNDAHSVEKQKIIKKGSKKSITKVGDVINLSDLFDENRVYFGRYKDKQHVKAEHFVGKVIVLLFAPRCVTSYCSQHDLKLLMDVYDELLPKGFEVIFVAPDKLTLNREVQISAQEFFDTEFSWMPWAVIPFSDKRSRQHVQRNLGVCQSKKESCRVYVVDPTGLVLQCNLENFQTYGATGYPFTAKRIKFLEFEDDAFIKRPSLEKLLTSDQRDFVITKEKEKVPIYTLEHKVVALYFYEESSTANFLTADKLWDAYEELSNFIGAFEVVLVYFSDTRDDKLFWEKFDTMPGLALPFEDQDQKRKLKRIFPNTKDPRQKEPRLVIIGRDGEIVEPFGADILIRYGVVAYPFTRKKVAELETEKVKELKLEMLWDANTVFRGKDGSQVPFSQFAGRKVAVFVERFHINYAANSPEIKFLKKLKNKYIQTKGTVDEFEVIHILDTKVSKGESIGSIHVGEMPWMVLPSDNLIATFDSYFWQYNDCSYSPILAFDEDGRLVRRTIYPTVEDMKFPFYAGGLEEEALAQLNSFFGWNH